MIVLNSQAAGNDIFLPIIYNGPQKPLSITTPTTMPATDVTATPTATPTNMPTASLTATGTLPSPTPTALPTLTATATPTATPAALSTSTATATFTELPTLTATATSTPTAMPTLTATPTKPVIIYMSTGATGTITDLTFEPEDIILFNTLTNGWSLYFDGADVGVTADVDALQLDTDGTILLSFRTQLMLAGITNPVDPADVVRFRPTELGENTSGSFELFFDGSDVGLENKSANVDGIGLAENGRLLISLNGVSNASGIPGSSEDLLGFTATSTGENTSGSWDLYFDGADMGLGNITEDLEGVWNDQDSDAIYLTTRRDFALYGGLTGDTNDIIICSPGTFGETTYCFFSLYWDGDAHGLGSNRIDGLDFGGELPPPPLPAPLPTPAPLDPANDNLYFSFGAAGSTNGLLHTSQDIIAYNRISETWSLVFDGSDMGITADIDAFYFEEDGGILLSFAASNALPGLATLVERTDIVRFTPTTLGVDTAGSFAIVLDGSDVELTTNSENIDAISWTPGDAQSARLVISTDGDYNALGLQGGDEDFLVFDAVSLGETTSGTWAIYFDGTDVGLDLTIGEDVQGLWIDPVTHVLYFTISSSYTLYGDLSGDTDDVIACAPVLLGETTICGFSIFWDGDAYGSGSNRISGFSAGKSTP